MGKHGATERVHRSADWSDAASWPDDVRAIAEWSPISVTATAQEDALPGFWSAAGLSAAGVLVLLASIATGQLWLAVFGAAIALLGIALIAA